MLKPEDILALRDFLHLILECTGQKKKDKEAKVATAKTLWVPP